MDYIEPQAKEREIDGHQDTSWNWVIRPEEVASVGWGSSQFPKFPKIPK